MEQSIVSSLFSILLQWHTIIHQPMFLNLVPLFFFVVRLFFYYPENARAACMIHLPACMPDCFWMLQWPGKLRLFARKSVRFLQRFLVLVFVFVRLWLCLFRQVLQVESLCVWLCISTWMWQRNLCHEPIFIPYSKKIAHSSKELLLFFRSNNTHITNGWMNERSQWVRMRVRFLFILRYICIR